MYAISVQYNELFVHKVYIKCMVVFTLMMEAPSKSLVLIVTSFFIHMNIVAYGNENLFWNYFLVSRLFKIVFP